MKKIVFILALCLICSGCEDLKVSKLHQFKKTETCINGYVYLESLNYYLNMYGITQVFEYVDGVTRPKMCNEK